jgi:hypothetical protein
MPNRMLVEGSPQAVASTPAQTSVSNAVAGVILYYNPRRKGFTIQNTGTTVLKLGMGLAAVPTQTVYHVALKGGAAADDGTGATYVDDAWVGDVWAISSAVGGTCVVAEYRSGSPDWNAAGDWGL